jgi:superfamily II DNA or RNA helicase
MRHVGLWQHELREWQEDAYEVCMDKVKAQDKSFMCQATPGGGKTRFSLRVVHKFLQARYCERIVIVAPTEHLKAQWAEDAFKYGIDLDPNFDNNQEIETKDFHGVVITYAQLGLNPEAHKRNIVKKSTLVVLDEIHHAGDQATWGTGIITAFENAVFVIGLSGTPFRGDAQKIPFVEYENGIGKFDYSYPYEDAVADNVCRPIYFPTYDGVMEWEVNGKKQSATFEDVLDDTRTSERLKTALDPNGDFLRQMIADANNKITEIREKEYHTDAAGLILTVDQSHAKRVAELVRKVTGYNATVVTSDEKTSSSRIKKFRDNSDRWIIAVKMISEGVDIPRLRVGVYATNVSSELFFRQAVGRFVRVIKHLESQDAYLYLPKDPRILLFAQTIEEEREHSLDKATRATGGADKIDTGEIKPEKEKKEFKAISAEVTGTEQLSFGFSTNDLVSKLFNISKGQANNVLTKVTLPQPAEEEKPLPIFEKIKLLREDISQLAKVYAKKKANGSGEIDWEIAHKDWMKNGGKSISSETVFELERRKKWLQKEVS